MKIAVLPGDGVGPEVLASGRRASALGGDGATPALADAVVQELANTD